MDVGLPDATLENRAESPLYGELYPKTVPAYTCPKQSNICNIYTIWSLGPITVLNIHASVGSESAPHFNMSLWSWVRALTEAKEKGKGHAPIPCEWDHPSSEWARGWGPYKSSIDSVRS